MEKMGLEEGQELEHPLLNRSIETAQKRVEQHNYQIRKRTLEYDDVMNKQREVVYGFRNEIIHGDDVRDRLMDVMEEVVVQKVVEFTSAEDVTEWRLRGLADWVNLNFPLGLPEEEIIKAANAGTEEPVAGSLFDGLTPAQFAACNFISKAIRDAYELKISFETNLDALKSVERYTILSAIDKMWQEHLYNMDGLRNSIGLRAYGQRDPLIEYKAEAFKIFEELMINIKTEICHNIFRSASSLMAFENFLRKMPQKTEHQSPGAFGGTTTASGGPAQEGRPSDVVSEATAALEKARPIRSGPKVGRNDPCPCGSGKKYKQCCGKFG
jgi:preprotein translocase subunit SecA